MDVAAELFAQRGYQGTTTRQIAAAAGVTEALIFRHFPKKEDLYWEIIEAKCKARGARSQLQERLNSSGDDATVFSGIAADILRRHMDDPQLFRLLLFSALENHKLSEQFFRIHISGYYEALAVRIRERIRSGKFRKVDPMLAARGFVGMMIHYFLVQELMGGKKFQKFDLEKVSETLSQIWLAGMIKTAVHRGVNGNGHIAGRGNGDISSLKQSKNRLKVLPAV